MACRHEEDKERMCETTYAWTMDTQCILCPNTKANAMYYRTKFQVHNQTFNEMESQTGLCYFWDEVWRLSSDLFPYLQYKTLMTCYPESQQLKQSLFGMVTVIIRTKMLFCQTCILFYQKKGDPTVLDLRYNPRGELQSMFNFDKQLEDFP